MKTLNTTLTLNGIETQVLVTYDTHIQSVQDGKREVLHLLSPEQVKALETEIAWNQLKDALRNEGVPTPGFEQLVNEGRL